MLLGKHRLVVDSLFPFFSFLMTNAPFRFYCAKVNRKLTPKLVVEVLNDPTSG